MLKSIFKIFVYLIGAFLLFCVVFQLGVVGYDGLHAVSKIENSIIRVIVSFLIGYVLFRVVKIVTRIPLAGTLLHVGAIVLVFRMMSNNPSTVMLILKYVVLPLATIDCLQDLLIIIEDKDRLYSFEQFENASFHYDRLVGIVTTRKVINVMNFDNLDEIIKMDSDNLEKVMNDLMRMKDELMKMKNIVFWFRFLFEMSEVMKRKNFSNMEIKTIVCSLFPAITYVIGACIGLSNLLPFLLLISAVAPRAFFPVAGIFATTAEIPRMKKIVSEIIEEIGEVLRDYIKASRLIDSGEFFGPLHFEKKNKIEYIEKQLDIGRIISNESTIAEEFEISYKKLEKLYPKNWWAKFTEKIAGDQEIIMERERAERELMEMNSKVSYISKEGFKEFSENAENRLREVSSMSPRDFIKKKFSEKSDSWLPLGVDFFLVKAFESGVMSGEIENESYSDDPTENHVYRHTRGKEMHRETLPADFLDE